MSTAGKANGAPVSAQHDLPLVPCLPSAGALRLDRRSFLGRTSSGALWLAAPASLLVACGGGGGGGDGSGGPRTPGDGPGPGAGLTPASRFASIAAVEAACADLEGQKLDATAYLSALTARMAQDPNYAEVGFDAQSLTAWGTFVDGRLHMVSHNFQPLAAAKPSPSAQMTARDSALPAQAQARLMHSFFTPFEGEPAMARMSGWLRAQGYAVRPAAEDDAHITRLRMLQGEGFFYINTHGGVKRTRYQDDNAPLMYSIQSATLVDKTLEAQADFKADFAAFRLTYFTAYNGLADRHGNALKDTRYGITASFVDAYWSFAQDSVVVINACNSANSARNNWVIDFLVACHRKGAGLYLGWSEICSPPAAFDIPAYFMDRVLGANDVRPETIRQRPFSGEEVIAHMERRGLNHDTGADMGAYFVAKANPRSEALHILRPSIHHLEVDELNNQLHLIGTFGRLEGEVEIGAVPVRVLAWAPDRVSCELLPVFAAGSHGEVVVRVKTHKSNIRRLTLWRLQVRYLEVSLASSALKIEGLATVYLRADAGLVREAPSEAPVAPARATVATRDSAFRMAASGSFSGMSWSGEMDYRSIPQPGGPVFSCALKIDPPSPGALQRTGALGLGVGHGVDQGFLAVFPPPAPSYRFAAAMGKMDGMELFPWDSGGASTPIPLFAFRIQFGADFTIPARSFTDPVTGATFRWDAAQPSCPPQSDDAI